METPDDSYGLIVGYEGIVLRYNGTIFERLISGLTSIVTDVAWKPDGSYAILVGKEGVAVKYDGTSFTSLTTGTTNNLNKISWVSDGSYALIVGDGSTILKFDGTDFDPIPIPFLSPRNLESVAWHPNGKYAILVGHDGLALKYNATDEEIYWLGHNIRLDTVAWKPDGSYGLLVGSGGTVMKYDNNNNFEILITGLATQLWDVAWNSIGSEALIVGSEGIIVSYDGISFSSVTTNTTNNIYRIGWSPSGNYALIVGAQGLVLRYESGCVTPLSIPINVDLNGITWNSTHALVVGHSGMALSWNGTDFEVFNNTITGTTRILWDAEWKPNGSYALIVSQNGEFLEFDGLNFYKKSTGDSYDFYSNYRCSVDWNPNGVLSVITGRRRYSPYYNIWHYDGATFVRHSVKAMPWDVSFHPSDDYAVIVGDAGYIWTFDSINLIRIVSPISKNLYGVAWRPDGSYALIVGESGTAMKYDGLFLTQLPTGVTKDLKAVAWSRDGSYALVVGASGIVLKFDGISFTPVPSGVYEDLLSVDFGPTIALIVGRSGRLLKFENSKMYLIDLNTTQDLQGVDWSPRGDYALVIGPSGHLWKIYFGPALSVSVTVDPMEVLSGGVSTITTSVQNGTTPIVGASVILSSSLGGSFSTTTDIGDGNYTATYTAPSVPETRMDRITATVLKAGFAPGSGFVDVKVIVPVSTQTRFFMKPNPALIGQTVTLLGNLTTTSGSPISNANIVIEVNGVPKGTMKTNTTGWFKATGSVASEGNFTVRAEYAGSIEYLPSYDEHNLTVRTMSISAYTDKYIYSSGDLMYLGLDVTNRGSATSVCIVIWVELPNGTTYDYAHYHNVTLPGGSSIIIQTFEQSHYRPFPLVHIYGMQPSKTQLHT